VRFKQLVIVTVFVGGSLLGEICLCLLPWPTSAVVGVGIVSSSLDGHIGLPWTAARKVKNLTSQRKAGAQPTRRVLRPK
jgi:hypothetical protein